MIKRQSGFTLIELMVALALGLLIVAAGLSVFLSSQRSLGLQLGMGELQQNANFGLGVLTYDLRHTNLNTVSAQRVNSVVPGSGVIFSAKNLPESIQVMPNLDKFYTLDSQDESNVDSKSDRLTIQYIPATNTIYNCEGTEITDALSKVIVQHYYIKKSPQHAGEPAAYSLMCDAGYYVDGGTEVTGLAVNAQQIIQRIDAFKVRLGVKNPAGQLRYMTIDEYTTAMKSIVDNNSTLSEDDRSKLYLNVVSIEVGMLARSTGTIGESSNLNTQKAFNIAGTEVTLEGDEKVNKRYLRQAVNQVVAIRNTLGAS